MAPLSILASDAKMLYSCLPLVFIHTLFHASRQPYFDGIFYISVFSDILEEVLRKDCMMRWCILLLFTLNNFISSCFNIYQDYVNVCFHPGLISSCFI